MSSGTALRLGQRVPDFEFETYEPAKGDFGTFSLASQIEKKRWTILFFYPGRFHFRLSDRTRCSGRAERAFRQDGL